MNVFKKVLLVFSSCMLALFLCNAVLEVYSYQLKNTFLSPTVETETGFDRRSKLEVVEELRRQGIDVLPSAYTHHILEYSPEDKMKRGDSLLPLGLRSHSKYVLCNELGQWSIFDYDRYGFHNRECAYNSLESAVLLIGDSMVEGQCVQEGEDIASILRLFDINAFSAATGGSGFLRQLATLKEYGRHFKPLKILWFFTEGNDLSEGNVEFGYPLMRRYLEDDFSQGLIDRQVEIDALWDEFIEERMKERAHVTATRKRFIMAVKPFVTLHKTRKLLGLGHMSLSAQLGLKRFRGALQKARDFSSDINAELVVVYLPSRNNFSGSGVDIELSVKEIIKDLGLPMIDIKAALMANADPLAYYPRSENFHHFNQKGYQLIAQEIASSLPQEMRNSRVKECL